MVLLGHGLVHEIKFAKVQQICSEYRGKLSAMSALSVVRLVGMVWYGMVVRLVGMVRLVSVVRLVGMVSTLQTVNETRSICGATRM